MKRIFLIVFSILLICSSCTGVYLPYLNERNDEFEDGSWDPRTLLVSVSEGGFGEPFEFKFSVWTKVKSAEFISFNIDSLSFQDKHGESIPFEYSYYEIFKPDTINVVIDGDKIHSVLGNTIDHQAAFGILAECKSKSKIMKIHYEFELNGKYYKGDSEYRKKIWINSKPSFPRQPWIITY